MLLRQNLNTRPWLVNTTQMERVSGHVTRKISPLYFTKAKNLLSNYIYCELYGLLNKLDVTYERMRYLG